MWHWNRRTKSGTCIAALTGALTLVAASTAHAAAPVTLAAVPKCPTSNSDFGSAVAISGPVAVIGAWNADNYHGAACVFAESRGAWHLQAVLNDPGNAKWDGFGYATATSRTSAGTYAMVSSEGTSGVTSSGIVYTYVRSGSTWHREETLSNPNRTIGASFGSSLAMSGTTAVVSDDGYKNGSGIVYVYVKSGNSWHLQATLSNPAPAANANFGGGVSISGSTIVVGDGIQPSPAARPRPGKPARAATVYAEAYVFTRSASKWHLQARLTDTSASQATSAAAVAVYGNVALLGAENGGSGQGETYVFRRTGTTWRRLVILHDPAKDDSNFGTSVALAGNIAVIGAPYGHTCGVAYVYEESRQGWTPRVKLVPPGKCGGLNLFGWAVSVSGKTAVVGAGYGGAYVMNVP